MFVFVVLVNSNIFGNLVSGVPIASDDEGNSVPKLTPSNTNFRPEMGQYFEGDIKKSHIFNRNWNTDETMRWPNGVIPYEFNNTLASDVRMKIMKGIDEFHRKTCIKFIEKSPSDEDYIHFTNDEDGSCSSHVGRQGGKQEVDLAPPGCYQVPGTVIHELMHAIGFWHEHNRADRDNYVTIIEKNVQKEKMTNFKKRPEGTTSDGEIGYDYQSAMQYSGTSFAKSNSKPSIVPKKRGVTLGQDDGFSRKDLLKLRKMYKCKNKIKRPLK